MALRKLTLSVEETVIEKARAYTERTNTSISRLVTEFLASLPSEKPRLAPAVERLIGVLPPESDIEEYRRHLEDKHRG